MKHSTVCGERWLGVFMPFGLRRLFLPGLQEFLCKICQLSLVLLIVAMYFCIELMRVICLFSESGRLWTWQGTSSGVKDFYSV